MNTFLRTSKDPTIRRHDRRPRRGTSYSRSARHPGLVGRRPLAGILAGSLLAVTLIPGGPASARASVTDPIRSYFAGVAAVLEYETGSLPVGTEVGKGSPSARAFLSQVADFQSGKAAELRRLDPPSDVAAAHAHLITAFDEESAAYQAALARTPNDAPFSDYYRYLYSDTRAGYAFVGSTNAKCDLQDEARRLGDTVFAAIDYARVCHPRPRRGVEVGNRRDPVNTVTIVHQPEFNPGYPRLWFELSEITARSSRPVTFTLDNRNPFPYLFNIAVYRGNPMSLAGRRPIAQTVPYGPKVHHLSIKLSPGTYTFVDMVHPYSARGILTVVPG